MPGGGALDTFQSGISLSICLHALAKKSGFFSADNSFQSGISLSICLHNPGGEDEDIGNRRQAFQSGISLSICLHGERHTPAEREEV